MVILLLLYIPTLTFCALLLLVGTFVWCACCLCTFFPLPLLPHCTTLPCTCPHLPLPGSGQQPSPSLPSSLLHTTYPSFLPPCPTTYTCTHVDFGYSHLQILFLLSDLSSHPTLSPVHGRDILVWSVLLTCSISLFHCVVFLFLPYSGDEHSVFHYWRLRSPAIVCYPIVCIN